MAREGSGLGREGCEGLRLRRFHGSLCAAPMDNGPPKLQVATLTAQTPEAESMLAAWLRRRCR